MLQHTKPIEPDRPQMMPQTADLDQKMSMSREEFDRRILFLEDHEIMEIDLSGLHLRDTTEVNTLYDRVEERIDETGEPLWFFMINYSGARIDPDAWFAWSRRGKAVNLAHSMGTVRYDASELTRKQIERSAGTESFDPNLFCTRDQAIKRLSEMPSRRVIPIIHTPNYDRAFFEGRVTFLMEEQIMEIDLHDFTAYHSRDVDDLYDYLEECVRKSDRKWFFLINYNNCRIMPEAWVRFASRGKDFNIAASLGTVRYAAGSETEADIRLRAESQGFRPNIRNTRDEALERIEEIKTETGWTPG